MSHSACLAARWHEAPAERTASVSSDLMPEFFVNGVVVVVLLTPILMPEFFVNGIVFVVLLTPILMP